jgi:hypothetical protein
MNKKYVLISLVTREKLTKEPYGRNILSLFYQDYPNLAPQTANFYEPINQPVPNVEAALEYWGESQRLYRRKNSVAGLWVIDTGRDDIGGCMLRYNWDNKAKWFQLFKQLVTLSKAYFGYVHIITENEREPAGLGSAIDLFLNGVTGAYLKKGIPQLGWGHYFGEEYVKELNVSLIKKLGFSIEPLGEGYVFHLTDQLSDVITDYDYFNDRRQLLKSLFRPELFQNYARYAHLS